jgi:hypothetical protein
MTLKFLVFSFDDSNLNSKQIQAKTKAEAIEKSGFSSAIAIASEVSASTYRISDLKKELWPDRQKS